MSDKNKNVLTYIVSISFVLFALLGVVHICCFDNSFYKREHDKLELGGKKIADYIGISRDELMDLTDFTLHYLNDPDASLDLKMKIKGTEREVFTDDEKAHMVDVRKLNLSANALCIISFTVFFICLMFYNRKKYEIYLLYRNYGRVLIYVLVFFGFIGTWILIDFNSFWNFFHQIFFAGNDLWILDLRKDILIMIVPPDFFNDLVLRIVMLFVASILGFWLLLYLANRKKAKQ